MGPDGCINLGRELASLGNLWRKNLAVELIFPEGSLLQRLNIALLCILQFGCQRRPLCRTGAAPIGTDARLASGFVAGAGAIAGKPQRVCQGDRHLGASNSRRKLGPSQCRLGS
eukprot:s1032_g5.t1